MITTIQNNVPRCPRCSAAMFRRLQTGKVDNYFVCNDCGAIYRIVDNGQSEIEILITDETED